MSSFLANLTVGSLLLGGALVLIVLLFLVRPFAMPEDEEKRIDREEIDGLLLRKESLLRDIRELDDDYEAAKVAPELYMRARPQMVKQAAVLMKQLDDHAHIHALSVHGHAEAKAAPPFIDPSMDAQIEAAIRRARTPQQLDDELEAAIRQARAKPAAKAAATDGASNGALRYCPQCGRRVEADDRFCPNCGRNLVQEQQPSQAARA